MCKNTKDLFNIYFTFFIFYSHTYFPLSWFWPQLPQDSPALPDDGEYGVWNIIYICIFWRETKEFRSIILRSGEDSKGSKEEEEKPSGEITSEEKTNEVK